MLNRLLKRSRSVARRYFHSASRKWSLLRRPAQTALSHQSPTPTTATAAAQIPLFQLDPVAMYTMVPKFSGATLKASKRAKTRKKSKKAKGPYRGPQYCIKLRLRKSERKLEFRSKSRPESAGNDFEWSMASQRQLHYVLLSESLAMVKNYAEIKSHRAAEIWAWIERCGHDEPFAFDTCVEMAGEFDPDFTGCDPEVVRNALKRLLRNQFGVMLPHRSVLKQGIVEAEAGNADAVRWCLSTADTPLSFNECCDALGFDPEDVRRELSISTAALAAVA
jgi:hypothetical protein